MTEDTTAIRVALNYGCVRSILVAPPRVLAPHWWSVAQVLLGPQQSEVYLLKSTGDIEENSETWDNWSNTKWFSVAFCALGVVPGILTAAVLTIYFLSVDVASETTIKKGQEPGSPGGGIVVPTIDEPVIPPMSLPTDRMGRKPKPTVQKSTATSPTSLSRTTPKTSPATRPVEEATTTSVAATTTPSAAVTTSPIPLSLPPPSEGDDSVCKTRQCHFMAQWLLQKLDPAADPCQDFYRFVCGTYKGPQANVFIGTINATKSMIIGAAYAANVVSTGQSAWHKAAGMFQACVSLGQSNRSQTRDLVEWMVSIDLDLRNLTALETVDPKDMIVRCSLDFGVHAIIAITLLDQVFLRGKRGILIDYSSADEAWQASRRALPKNRTLLPYVNVLRLYGLNQADALSLASNISEYEIELEAIVLNKSAPGSSLVLGTIRGMRQKTKPYITGDDWSSAFSKYTNNTYNGQDVILYKPAVLDIVAELFKNVDAEGVRYLIAWSVLRQMVPYTDPRFLRATNSVTDTCYSQVERVMKVALASPYLHHVTTENTVRRATSILKTIRAAFRTAFETSSWVTGDVQQTALKKLDKMKYFVGSPGQRLDYALIDNYYASPNAAVRPGPAPPLSPRRAGIATVKTKVLFSPYYEIQCEVTGHRLTLRRLMSRKNIREGSRMPALPREETKVVVWPIGGLCVSKLGPSLVAEATWVAAGLDPHERNSDTMCPDLLQNFVVVSAASQKNATCYVDFEAITVAGQDHEVGAYVAAPHATCKGAIRGFPLSDGPEAIDRKRVIGRNPLALGAMRIKSTGAITALFDGYKVPN
ncbi:hypothetical protein HPB50_004150 [Hyalomma asiaticum]|uniref:Uncharacterized protein n=1 Tax=Hyalomma asiaticum TaxID=266040 RepID=A0ACB7SDX1_HYAAI|nr:hypothetical protein HPB50_004150 [Hyalomma asiaticum]